MNKISLLWSDELYLGVLVVYNQCKIQLLYSKIVRDDWLGLLFAFDVPYYLPLFGIHFNSQCLSIFDLRPTLFALSLVINIPCVFIVPYKFLIILSSIQTFHSFSSYPIHKRSVHSSLYLFDIILGDLIFLDGVFTIERIPSSSTDFSISISYLNKPLEMGITLVNNKFLFITGHIFYLFFIFLFPFVEFLQFCKNTVDDLILGHYYIFTLINFIFYLDQISILSLKLCLDVQLLFLQDLNFFLYFYDL